MVRKSNTVAGIAPSDSLSEKHRSNKTKEKSKVQNAWLETLSKTRERVPLPSLHLKVSLTDMSRPWLGKWTQARRGNDNIIPVVRTKSQAGMLRPTRFPTIYRSNARLFIDPYDEPLPTRARPLKSPVECEKHSVIVDSPKLIDLSPEKQLVTVDVYDGIEITLSSRIDRVEHIPSRFEELNDDASVHELEAVFATENLLSDEYRQSDRFVLCEANDPTAFTELEKLQRSFTMHANCWPRPQMSLSTPRSKSLYIQSEDVTARLTSTSLLPSPPSAAVLSRSLTKTPALGYSIVSPRTPINMPQPVRPYSSISVPLFMEASELDQAVEEVPPLPTSIEAVAERMSPVPASGQHPSQRECRHETGSNLSMSEDHEEALSRSTYSSLNESSTSDVDDHDDGSAIYCADAGDDGNDPVAITAASSIADADDEDDEDASVDADTNVAGAQDDIVTGADPMDHVDAVDEDFEDGANDGAQIGLDDDDDEDSYTDDCCSTTKKSVAESINKPLPPEPPMRFPTVVLPLTYRPKLRRMAQSQETLPRSRYSSPRMGEVDALRRRATSKPPRLDQAFAELEWRLSTMRQSIPRSDDSFSTGSQKRVGGSMLMPPSRSSRSGRQSTPSGKATTGRRCLFARSRSASQVSRPSRNFCEGKKSRSYEDLQSSIGRHCHRRGSMRADPETWYRTASERSSADLSRSVFSDAGTDGTCQTEQSQSHAKGKETGSADDEGEENEVITKTKLPRSMWSCDLTSAMAELIVLQIMSNLTTLKDLFSTAALNKGFYEVFKRHELELIKKMVYKSSRPAWELREISEERPVTPTTYLRLYSVEIYTLAMLKSLILVQCESFLRPGTIAGLVGTDEDEVAAIDAAFWRVWTFCSLFGRSAGQDQDVETQIDWLNGGRLAQQRDPSTTFGIGNGDGLTKDEVHDMIEISTCLGVLMQTFHGRVEEARAAGIYASCEANSHPVEALLLEEWTWYIMTLGPLYILTLAPGSFATATDQGVTEWSPPAMQEGNTRSKFFKEALTRVYKARLAEEPKPKTTKTKRSSKTSSHRMTKSELAREIERARQSAFAKELQSQRQQSPNKSEPLAFSDERPMSAYSQIVKNLPHGASRISAQDLALLPKPPSHFVSSRPASTKSGYTTPRCPQTPVLTSSSAVPSADDDDFPISPPGCGWSASSSSVNTIEVPVREPGQVVDPSDRALAHLVSGLGYGREEAKWALRRSENGHGINVERAIDILVNGSASTISSRASSRQDERDAVSTPSPPPAPVEVESSQARPIFTSRLRISNPIRMLQQRDSMVTNDEMTAEEKERANKMRMREKSYRVLGIASQPGQSPPRKQTIADKAKRGFGKRRSAALKSSG